MCPNGAKVQLNMGITERRYRNWDAALGHYLRARELAGEGFCEPDYWIGVTRINQGDEVALGAEVRPTCFPAAASMQGLGSALTRRCWAASAGGSDDHVASAASLEMSNAHSHLMGLASWPQMPFLDDNGIND